MEHAKLVFKEPALRDWNQALPIGCGRLGAMIFGNPAEEHYQLNEDSVWSGGPLKRINPDAKPNLDKVRDLIFQGKIPQAERLLKFAFSGTPQSERCFQPLGDMHIDMMQEKLETAHYVRELDLENALHTVTYREKETGIVYHRETFASAPANCIITRIWADGGHKVSAAARILRPHFCERFLREDGCILMEETLGSMEGGLREYGFSAGIKMCAKGGTLSMLGENYIGEDADEIIIYMTAGTHFYYEDPREHVVNTLNAVSEKTYEELKAEHIRDYQAYYHRVKLTLQENETEGQSVSNSLMKLYFDFGRYLLITASRPGSLPANLQGIWNKEMDPPWGSKYTVNINTEMNYWPAEMMGLSEMHLPLFDLLERMAVNGKETAREMYGCRGFVCHHNTDIWADTAPQDVYTPATVWPMSSAWLCTHIWQHYDYTRDMEFLKRMYPVLKEAVTFYLDFLVEYKGYLVTNPSVSPENTYILPDGTKGCVCFGPTMDNQILRELFGQYLRAAALLQESDTAFRESVKTALSKLPPNQIGREGQLLEWVEEYGEDEPGHRHISHLYGLHPASQIRMGSEEPGQKALVNAAKTTLKRRLANGGGHTGWSRAWIMNLYARLWDGEACYDNFVQLLEKSTLPNLLDNHPPFQIDGNFGAVAAVGEMLLQSVEQEVYLLPALPKEWRTGSIEGIRARGNAAYDIFWEDGVLERFRVHAASDYEATVFCGGASWKIQLCSGESVEKRLQ